jgi:ABC-2 type transport system permease protein
VSARLPLQANMVIVKDIFLKDIPAEVVFGNIWPMAAIAIVTLTFATLFFRRRLT